MNGLNAPGAEGRSASTSPRKPRACRLPGWTTVPLGALYLLLTIAVCSVVAAGQSVAGETAQSPVAPGVVRVGTIEHFALTEGSGLAASRRHPGVVWTHNDGGYQFVFALDELGRYLGAFQVVGANLIDWEAMAADADGHLYLADIGSNGLARTHIAVHRVREPNPADRFGNVEVERTWLLRFPGPREDCEAFFVLGLHGYLITKPRAADGQVTMFRFALSRAAGSIELEPVIRFPVRASVTDASVSPDGRRLAVLTSEGAYLYRIDGVPAAVGNGPAAFTFFENTFMEGGTLVDDGFLVSAETRELWLFNDEAFQCNTPPGVGRPLADRMVFAGQDVILAPEPLGCPAPSSQWRFNGELLAGETNVTLVLTNVTPADGGRYELVLSNRWGQVTTAAQVAVVAGPALRLIVAEPGRLRIELEAIGGYVYRLELLEELGSGAWIPAGLEFEAFGPGTGAFEVSTVGMARYFRVRVEPRAAAQRLNP